MTDIVERLHRNATMFAFPDTMLEAAYEIERLQHMKANLHSHIKRLEDENGRLKGELYDWRDSKEAYEAENAKLREALEEAAKELERDLMPFAASKVRAVLTPRSKTPTGARSTE